MSFVNSFWNKMRDYPYFQRNHQISYTGLRVECSDSKSSVDQIYFWHLAQQRRQRVLKLVTTVGIDRKMLELWCLVKSVAIGCPTVGDSLSTTRRPLAGVVIKRTVLRKETHSSGPPLSQWPP